MGQYNQIMTNYIIEDNAHKKLEEYGHHPILFAIFFDKLYKKVPHPSHGNH